MDYGKLLIIVLATVASIGSTLWLASWRRKRRAFVLDLHHGCRAIYGPLELRIRTTKSSSGFLVGVDDLRLDHRCVREHSMHGDLDMAKVDADEAAGEYLNGRDEEIPESAVWRCS